MKKLLLTMLLVPTLSVMAEVYGGYGEIQGGSANSSGYNSGVNNSGGARIAGGTRFDPYMGVEVGFTGLTRPTVGDGSALQFYDASFKGILPLSEVLDLHAQAGAAYGVGSTNVSNFDATPKILVGVGCDINLTRSFSLTVNDYGYLSPNLDAGSGVGGNTNFFAGGVKVNF